MFQRFEHSTAAEKVEGKLDFPMELNMLPYTTKPKSSKKSNYVYDLQSAIIHKGKIDSGHYIAYCRQGADVSDCVNPMGPFQVANCRIVVSL